MNIFLFDTSNFVMMYKSSEVNFEVLNHSIGPLLYDHLHPYFRTQITRTYVKILTYLELSDYSTTRYLHYQFNAHGILLRRILRKWILTGIQATSNISEIRSIDIILASIFENQLTHAIFTSFRTLNFNRLTKARLTKRTYSSAIDRH